MNKYSFNKDRYLKLLDEERNLKQKNKSLYRDDKKKYRELLSYQVRLEENNFWKNRGKCSSLVIKFINGKITGDYFTERFFDFWTMMRDYTVNDDIPISESEGFGKYINRLFFCCEDFDEEVGLSEEYGENWLKNEVEKIWVEMQENYTF